MANNSATINTSQQQQQAGHFQQPNSAHHCKECGLFFDSGKSLEVHLQYHKENLLNKWATQAAGQASIDQETNNNNTATTAIKGQPPTPIKRESFNHGMSGSSGGGNGGGTIAAAADSSDSMIMNKSSNKSPDSYNSRTTPETSTTSFGHPPTPQSYHSAPSPYQSHAEGSTNFSPGYQSQSYQAPIKSERASPSLYNSQQYMPQHMYSDQQQYFGMDQQQLGYPQDYPVHKIPGSQASSVSAFRYHPYGGHPGGSYDRSPQVSSSSPAYPSHNSQPTPSPSPKQCDKCGCVCDSAAQLIEHLSHAHPPTPSPSSAPGSHHLSGQPQLSHTYQQHPQHQFAFADIKQEMKQGGDDEPQTEILDLDSHKVHHVFQSPEEEEEMKRNGEMAHGNPHSVSAMLGSWSAGSPTQKMYSPGGAREPTGIFGLPAPEQGAPPPPEHPKHPGMFAPHPSLHPGDYIVQAGVTTSGGGPETGMLGPAGNMGQYRPFEHLPPQPNPPVISSTQLSGGGGAVAPVGNAKGANWKSNEARRPKTYNCSACNKWFTSSGHLKRHYNTTLHKNAVKSSGQPDPATLPISAHHHPGRDERTSGSRQTGAMPDQHSSSHSPDSAEDGNARAPDDLSPASVYERAASGGLLQQPPSGPYDRQPGLSMGPGPPGSLHSPMTGSPGLSNMSTGSPPNGEAGPSASQDHLSRGLLSISTLTNNTPATHQQQQVTTRLGQPLSPMGSNLAATNSPQGFTLFQPQNHHLQQQQHMMGTGSSPLHSPQHQLLPDPTITSSTQHMHTHHPQQQQAFHPMSPSAHSIQQPNYPNGSAPHVMPVTAISSQQPASTSLTITGDQYGATTVELYSLVGQPQQQQQQQVQQQYFTTGTIQQQGATDQHQPLPSFAQFQTAHHRYGILLAAPPGYHQHTLHPANVGGAGPITDPLFQHTTTTLATTLQQSPGGDLSPVYRHLSAATADPEYDITVLESAAHGDLTADGLTVLSTGDRGACSPTDGAIQIKSEHNSTKHDYEHGSPQISSTGSPLGPGRTNGTNVVSGGHTANAGPHKCIDCDKVFNKACYLTQHNKTFHSGDKPFKCHRCGKRFPSEPSYQEHLAKHAGDKPYKCELCPKQFNHKTDLRRHMCLHTGQKPYACEHCGKGFIRKDHMLKHAETHTRKTHHHSAKHAAAAAAAAASS